MQESERRWMTKGYRSLVPIVLAGAVWLTGGGSASAGDFVPAFDVSVSNANPGVRANVTFVQSVPAGNHLIDSINTFIPINWQIASGDTYLPGNIVGQVSAKADLGCNGSVDTLTPGNLVNQMLGPSDPSQAEWEAFVNGTWQLLFVVEEIGPPREWSIQVVVNNPSRPANMCSPQEFSVVINGSASPSGAQVIANPTHADPYLWEDWFLSVPSDHTHIEFVNDTIVIGTDTDADGLANEVDPDDDNDGFSDAAEATIGTNPLLDCGINANPADFNNDTFFDVTDIGAVAARFGQSVPPAPARYNIAPDPPDGTIDITDIAAVAGLFGQSCV